VTLVDDQGRRISRAASDPVVQQADDLQYEFDEGPCLTAWAQRSLVRIDDMATEQRWPRWCPRALHLGLHATLSAPLVAGDTCLGAMKVYVGEPHVFDERAERLMTMFATQATVVLASVQSCASAQLLSEELRDAIRTRDLVALAKGMLMERHHLDEAGAFRHLLTLSRQPGKTLRTAAQEIAKSSLSAGVVEERRGRA
jgi:GAF domain-containing protein